MVRRYVRKNDDLDIETVEDSAPEPATPKRKRGRPPLNKNVNVPKLVATHNIGKYDVVYGKDVIYEKEDVPKGWNYSFSTKTHPTSIVRNLTREFTNDVVKGKEKLSFYCEEASLTVAELNSLVKGSSGNANDFALDSFKEAKDGENFISLLKENNLTNFKKFYDDIMNVTLALLDEGKVYFAPGDTEKKSPIPDINIILSFTAICKDGIFEATLQTSRSKL